MSRPTAVDASAPPQRNAGHSPSARTVLPLQRAGAALDDGTLESRLPDAGADGHGTVESLSHEAKPRVAARRQDRRARRVLIPVFPGTNCEYDTRARLRRGGRGRRASSCVRNLHAADDVARQRRALCSRRSGPRRSIVHPRRLLRRRRAGRLRQVHHRLLPQRRSHGGRSRRCSSSATA